MDRYFLGLVLAEFELDQAANWGLLVVHEPLGRAGLGQDRRSIVHFVSVFPRGSGRHHEVFLLAKMQLALRVVLGSEQRQ